MQRCFVDGPVGKLDVRIHGEGSSVLVLHPHPRFQGTMGSRMVFDLCEELAAHGYQAIRFNYRGVQRSEGTYGDGLGETEDTLAVAEALTLDEPHLVGYSFGSGVAARAVAVHDLDVASLTLLAPPPIVNASKLNTIELASRLPAGTKGFIGTQDPLVRLQDAHALFDEIPDGDLEELEDLGHFLDPSETQVVAPLVRAWLDAR